MLALPAVLTLMRLHGFDGIIQRPVEREKYMENYPMGCFGIELLLQRIDHQCGIDA